MEDLEKIERLVEAGAKRGASSCSMDRQVIADAVEITLSRWVHAVLHQKRVGDWCRWAFRTAANAVKKIAAHRSRLGEVAIGEERRAGEASGKRIVGAKERAALVARIEANKSVLIGRQAEVLLKLCAEGMSLHRAARELGMDRSALRRSFKSGVARLRKC